ncbi:radical SAM protein [Acidobacteriota bacterium]
MSYHLKIKKIQRALDHLSPHESHCTLCPHECGADRKNGEKGYCESGMHAKLSHAVLHFGEEPVLSGSQEYSSAIFDTESTPAGSGTLFFSGCNLKCLFCQNYQLSWFNQGSEYTPTELAQAILKLQDRGALNINLVSPMHFLIPILRSLELAYKEGLRLPVVYNTNAYEKVEILILLEGIIDIYLPDLKFYSSLAARTFCGKSDYFQHASLAIKEMYRQKPDLRFTDKKTAQEGLIIRHLFLPRMLKDSIKIIEWIAGNVSLSIGLSLMSQYIPCFRAPETIQNKMSPEDYRHGVEQAQSLGFETLFIQPEPFEKAEHLNPDFDKKTPFKWRKKY